MLETELKCIITEDLYNRLRSAFDWDSVSEQTNHYYADADGLLGSNRVMVRVRVKNGVSKLQIKQKRSSESPLQICEETEFDIDGAADTISPQPVSETVGYEVGALSRLGFAKTLRSSIMWDDSTEICLDKTEYLGVTDYEIEIEYTDELNSELTDYLSELGVVFEKNSVGKFSRFMKRLKAINE